MIAVRCPTCEKVVGFDEADGGALVACPHCREPFCVPVVARPVDAEAAPVAAPAQGPAAPPPIAARLPPPRPLPDDLRLADDGPEPCDELEELPVLEEVAQQPLPPPGPALGSACSLIPNFELGPPRLAPQSEPPEPTGTPAVVQTTDLAPSLAAAESLAEALPPERTEAPTDVLEEVRYELKDDGRSLDAEEDEERQRRRAAKRRRAKRRIEDGPRPTWSPNLTRDRILGAIAVGVGGPILLGTVLHHLTASASAWHGAVCCGDLFALGLCGVGLYFLIKG